LIFTAITEAGLNAGCHLLGFTDQHHFMVGAGESRMRAFENGHDRQERDQFLRKYKMLMHPEMMGLAFKYLLIGKEGYQKCVYQAGSDMRATRENRCACKSAKRTQ